MTETELVHEVRRLATEIRTRTSMWAYFHEANSAANLQVMLDHDAELRREGRQATGLPDTELPLPATWEAVRVAQETMSLSLPPLLCRLWTEIGNGGFGPGYGIFGVEGGACEDDSYQLTTAPLYLEFASRTKGNQWRHLFGAPWPPNLVPICGWGGGHLSAIDCTTPEGEMVDLIEGTEPRRKGMTFAQWMEAWANGVDLWTWEEGPDEEE